MTELALMLIASQLISNPSPNTQAQYAALNQVDQAKVEAYIADQDELPGEIEQMIAASNKLQRSGIVENSANAPTRETGAK